jgi:hypothetical protein
LKLTQRLTSLAPRREAKVPAFTTTFRRPGNANIERSVPLRQNESNPNPNPFGPKSEMELDNKQVTEKAEVSDGEEAAVVAVAWMGG